MYGRQLPTRTDFAEPCATDLRNLHRWPERDAAIEKHQHCPRRGANDACRILLLSLNRRCQSDHREPFIACVYAQLKTPRVAVMPSSDTVEVPTVVLPSFAFAICVVEV